MYNSGPASATSATAPNTLSSVISYMSGDQTVFPSHSRKLYPETPHGLFGNITQSSGKFPHSLLQGAFQSLFACSAVLLQQVHIYPWHLQFSRNTGWPEKALHFTGAPSFPPISRIFYRIIYINSQLPPTAVVTPIPQHGASKIQNSIFPSFYRIFMHMNVE